VETSILVKPNFNKTFVLNVDWLVKGVGAILSQKLGRKKQVITYVHTSFISYTTLFSPYGIGVLCPDLGHNAL
jgi:hypothetical protein